MIAVRQNTTTKRNLTGLHPVERRWFAVYTLFRREKSAVSELERKNIMAYTPIIKRVKRYTRKTKTTHLPLINHYVFVKINQKEYLDVVKSRDVVSFLKFNQEMIAVPEEEIILLKRIVGAADDVELIDFNPNPGQSVEIINGKLTGLKGVVIEEYGKQHIVVELDHIGMTLRIQVDKKMLVPLH